MKRWAGALFFGLMVVLAATGAQAELYVVDNDTSHTADFQDAQEAIDAASDGDTLYFVGSAASYGDLVVKKPVHLIGPGYFLGENGIQEANPSMASFGKITVYRDADGGTVGVICDASGTSIHGLSVSTMKIEGESTDYPLEDITIISNKIHNCDITRSDGLTYRKNCHTYNLTLAKSLSAIISNNLFIGGGGYLSISDNASATVMNNTICCNFSINNSTISNNIINKTFSSCNDSQIYNNLSSQYIGADNGNISGVAWSTIHVGATNGSTDGQYQLLDGCAAKGAGANGEDLGAFGGTDPYVLSGRSTIPTVYFFTAPPSATAASGLAVSISAKSRN